MKTVIKDIVISLGITIISTLLSLLLVNWGIHESNILMVYILAILFIATLTNNFLYPLCFSIIAILTYNFFFTEPKFTLDTLDPAYSVTFIIMFIAGLIVSSTARRLKKQKIIIDDSKMQKEMDRLKLEKEQARSNILRSMSHDIRTPLTSIINGIEALRDKYDDEIIDDIESEAEWLSKMIQNILSATKIEQGRLTIKKQRQLAEELVAEIIHNAKRYSRGHEIKLSIPEELIELKVDAGLIVQLMINLLDNAFKYASDNTPIEFNVSQSEANVIFEIVNEGNNISEYDLPHLFEMFYRSEKSGDKSKGDGIGLAVCKSIANAHGGEIYATNIGENKVSFTVILPKESNDE